MYAVEINETVKREYHSLLDTFSIILVAGDESRGTGLETMRGLILAV